jgi:hypothetical protein
MHNIFRYVWKQIRGQAISVEEARGNATFESFLIWMLAFGLVTSSAFLFGEWIGSHFMWF